MPKPSDAVLCSPSLMAGLETQYGLIWLQLPTSVLSSNIRFSALIASPAPTAFADFDFAAGGIDYATGSFDFASGGFSGVVSGVFPHSKLGRTSPWI